MNDKQRVVVAYVASHRTDSLDAQRICNAFKDGIEYGYNLAIEKATKWLEEHQEDFSEYDAWKGEYIDFKELIKDLKETMKL